MYAEQAWPTAANANPMSSATGTASTAQNECSSPRAAITSVNAAAYRQPRNSAQLISPSATSAGRMGVASIASYSFTYFNLKNTLNVESYSAPFIADTARRPCATNSRQGTGPPGPATGP